MCYEMTGAIRRIDTMPRLADLSGISPARGPGYLAATAADAAEHAAALSAALEDLCVDDETFTLCCALFGPVNLTEHREVGPADAAGRPLVTESSEDDEESDAWLALSPVGRKRSSTALVGLKRTFE